MLVVLSATSRVLSDFPANAVSSTATPLGSSREPTFCEGVPGLVTNTRRPSAWLVITTRPSFVRDSCQDPAGSAWSAHAAVQIGNQDQLPIPFQRCGSADRSGRYN